MSTETLTREHSQQRCSPRPQSPNHPQARQLVMKHGPSTQQNTLQPHRGTEEPEDVMLGRGLKSVVTERGLTLGGDT